MGYTRGNDGPITLIPISHSSEHNVRMTGYWYSRVLLRKAHRTSFQVQGSFTEAGIWPIWCRVSHRSQGDIYLAEPLEITTHVQGCYDVTNWQR
jgi:hypothetical protein